MRDLDRLVEFLSQATSLKDVRRSGWKFRGIKQPESVASHCWLTALMVAILGEKGIKPDRAVLMALLHDIGNILTGDVAERLSESDQALADREKREYDDVATQTIISLADQSTARRLLAIWKDYKAGKSPEARFVRQIEALEMALQAASYERANRNPYSLREFFDHVRLKSLRDEKLFDVLYAIEALRKRKPLVTRSDLMRLAKNSKRIKRMEAKIFKRHLRNLPRSRKYE